LPAFITGTGLAVPNRVVLNEELAPVLGLNPEQIFKSSGIRRRRRAELGTTAGALEHALAAGDHPLLLPAFGAGFTWGARLCPA
jgi:3-oxoacyl-[acyl-carrier-protein] synthase III